MNNTRPETVNSKRDMMTTRIKELSSTAPLGTSLKDKDLIIAELKNISKQLSNDNASLLLEKDNYKERVAQLEDKVGTLSETLKNSDETVKAYENYKFVPDSVDYHGLQESIAQIEKDIVKFEIMTGDPVPRNTTISRLPASTEGKVQALVEMKFQRLEDLIFVLKKRILKLEENEVMAEVIEKYGNVSYMVSENERLKSEVSQLLAREERFKTQPLVVRRKLEDMDTLQMRVFILALQNELVAANRLISAYNLKENPTLGLLVRPPPDISPMDVGSNVNELLRAASTTDRVGGYAAAATRDAEMDAVRRVLAAKEEELLTTSFQVDVLTRELQAAKEALTAALNLNGTATGIDAKKIKMKTVTATNADLLDQVAELRAVIASRDSTIQLLEETHGSVLQRLEDGQSENLALSATILKLTRRGEEKDAVVEAQKKCVEALRSVAYSLTDALFERVLPVGERQQLLEFFHRDVIFRYFTYSQAAIRLQSWWRGTKTRQALQTGTQPYPSPFPTSIPGSALASPFSPTAGQRVAAADRHTAIADLFAGHESIFAYQPEEIKLQAFLPPMQCLNYVIEAGESDAQRLSSAPILLRAARLEVLHQLRPQILAELHAFEEEFRQQILSLSLGVSAVCQKGTRVGLTQTEIIKVPRKHKDSAVLVNDACFGSNEPEAAAPPKGGKKK